MDMVFEAFKDDSFRSWYLAFAFGVMVLPMIAMSWWYHSNINKTAGGRKLMRDHRGTQHHLATGVRLASNISKGRYGGSARRMQTRVYWLTGFWIAALVIVFGLLLWADEVNRVTG